MRSEQAFSTLRPLLMRCEKPARYLGGENHAVEKTAYELRVVLCFPDLYEIGMSNNAMRILYSRLNAIDGVFCDRLFTPADDFAALLRESGTELYGLDSGLPVRQADILAFTVGYELAATTILYSLDVAGIPALKAERETDDYPLLIAGGPGISNPLPYSDILDAVWIGEAEDAFFDFCAGLVQLKRSKAGRPAIEAAMAAQPAFWWPGKPAARHIDHDFSSRANYTQYPQPVLKPVQEHGVVEIMRGCPNGCRFCHAGFHYRPCRFKEVDVILEEVDRLVEQGFTTITLSSLSSGDYPGIFELVSHLNRRYGGRGVSFQLPSLKVESFSLDLIDQVSGVRKSALTFAVETPLEAWQLAINKKVTIEKITAILKTAKEHGYRLAKFYFMIGLPLPQAEQSEEEAIIAFLGAMLRACDLQFNVTISTFVPKPFTPYQRASQIQPDEAFRRIFAIKDAFAKQRRVRISYHHPLMSSVEGFIARGDRRVGPVLLAAQARGCRFDAWDDSFQKATWQALLEEHPSLAFDPAAPLPWKAINERVSAAWLDTEACRSEQAELTAACADSCTDLCGSCSQQLRVQPAAESQERLVKYLSQLSDTAELNAGIDSADRHLLASSLQACRTRIVCQFSKTGAAAFYAHHDLIKVFSQAMQQSGLLLEFTQGFNPAPRLELSEPMPLGFASDDEYAAFMVHQPLDTVLAALDEARLRMQGQLPPSLCLGTFLAWSIVEGQKINSLSSLYWGSEYQLDLSATDFKAEVLAKRLETLLREVDAPACLEAASVYADTNTSLRILLPASGVKAYGLSALLTKALDGPLMRSRIAGKRLRQFARLPGGGGAVSYLELFSQRKAS